MKISVLKPLGFRRSSGLRCFMHRDGLKGWRWPDKRSSNAPGKQERSNKNMQNEDVDIWHVALAARLKSDGVSRLKINPTMGQWPMFSWMLVNSSCYSRVNRLHNHVKATIYASDPIRGLWYVVTCTRIRAILSRRYRHTYCKNSSPRIFYVQSRANNSHLGCVCA